MSKSSKRNKVARKLASKMGLYLSKQGTNDAAAFKKPGSGK